MATTKFGTNDAQTVKAWSDMLSYEAPKAMRLGELVGKSKDSIIYRHDNLQRGAGDDVTCTLLRQLTGRGRTEGEKLEGHEESIASFTDSVTINKLRHAVRVRAEGSIDQQRIVWNMRTEGKELMKDWMADRFSLALMVQLCGYTSTTLTFEGESLSLEGIYYGFNTPLAPSSNRVVRPNGRANDQSLVAGDEISLATIDHAKWRAETANPRVRPIMIGGEKKYVMVIHPNQEVHLRTDTSSGNWLDIKKNEQSESRQAQALYKGAIGEWNNVIVKVSEHVCPGVHSSTGVEQTNVRRAVLLGAQAAAIAFGKYSANALSSMKWFEEEFDYGEEHGVSSGAVFGLKKTRYNGEDFGVVTVPTYAPAPAGLSL